MTLRDLFDTPSSFESDPRGFARNAIGHALIVGALPAYLFPAMIPLALALYAAWEVAQWRLRDAAPWDCVHDWAYVAGGAVAVLHPVIALPLAAFFAADVLRRA